MKHTVAALGIGVLMLAAVSAAADSQPVARITETNGAVTFRHGDQWQAVTKAPVELFDGDKVNTDKGRATVFFVGDESTVVLDVGTNITISQPSSFGSAGFVRRVEIYVGDLWFKMTKGASQHTDLATPTAVGGLRGTEGLVHVESAADSSFTLNEGELQITPVGGPSIPAIALHGGQTLRAVQGQTFMPRAAAAAVSRPDVHVTPDKLPEPAASRLNALKVSERPTPEATEAAAHLAASTHRDGESERPKPKEGKPSRPAPKVPRRKP
jgi:hypothetical protein